MKYYLIAGEASGDLHGSNLMRGLLKSDPAARFRFWGGDRMAEVGGAENRVRDYRETSFFGIVGVLRNLGTISRQLRECREDVLRYAPDVLILVDYPGFNMKMARFAKEHGIRTFYYIAPKVWAWREWRVKAIRRYVDRLYIIFHFERDYATASRPYSRGIRCSTPSRLGRRRSPRARSSAVRTDWTNGPWWRSWRAAAAAKSKPTCR